MRTIKMIMSVLIVIVIAATIVLCGQYTLSEQRGGGTSPVCHISKEARQFIIEEFGWCDDVPTLIDAIEEYEVENFSYDKSYAMPLIQDFDFDEFLEAKKGVCWELSAFAKCVIHEISLAKKWNVSNYIVDVRLNHEFDRTHSYNYVIDDGTIYTFDMTVAVGQHKSWIHSFQGNSLDDIYRYAGKLKDDVYRVH